jgi:hypothetical protein
MRAIEVDGSQGALAWSSERHAAFPDLALAQIAAWAQAAG